VVNNGVDVTLKEEVQDKDRLICDEIIELRKNYFVMVHTGTIYQGQNIGFFIDFIEKFNKKHHSTPLLLVCIGLAENMIDTKILNSSAVRVLNKVDLRSSLYIQRVADALVLPTWIIKVYSGFAAKVFEYIHSGNNVLCSPNPTPDLEEFIVQFNNVFIAKDFESMEKHVIILLSNRKNKVIEKNNSPMLFRRYWINEMAKYLQSMHAGSKRNIK